MFFHIWELYGMKYVILLPNSFDIDVCILCCIAFSYHDDVIKWDIFRVTGPIVRGIHRSAVNFPHKGQWRRAHMHSLICFWINGWVNNHEAGNLKRNRTHDDVTVMMLWYGTIFHHTGPLLGNPSAMGGFLSQMPVIRNLDISFDVSLKKIAR